jgi:hypothetical protein
MTRPSAGSIRSGAIDQGLSPPGPLAMNRGVGSASQAGDPPVASPVAPRTTCTGPISNEPPPKHASRWAWFVTWSISADRSEVGEHGSHPVGSRTGTS